MNTTISVVIPCYNGSPFLRETLDSVLAQTHRPLEVLVVDDGSTDDSAALAESYGPPVRVIRQENQGESVARNRGMDEARGDWIALVDADDLWDPRKLEKQLAAAGSDTVCVHTNMYMFGAEDRVGDYSAVPAETRYSTFYILTDRCPLNPSTILFRRELPVRYPTWTRYYEDVLFGLELARQGPIVLVAEPLAGYRRHAAGQSARLSIWVDRHQAVARWLRDNPDATTESQRAEIEAVYRERLAKHLEIAKWRRDWAEYRRIRQYLRELPGPKEAHVEALIRQRLYPTWTYPIKDTLDKVLRT